MDLLKNPDRAPGGAPSPEPGRDGRSARERSERAALVMLSALLVLWAAALWAWTIRP